MTTLKRGFTYVEISAVLVLMILVAVLVTPQLMRLNEGRLISEFKSNLKSIPISARELAISRGEAVQVRYDQDERQIVVETVPTSSDGTSSSRSNSISGASVFSSANLNNQQAQQIRSVTVPPIVDASSFMLAGSSSDAASWTLCFYPDGTADTGGIGFAAGNYSFALSVREDGKYLLQDGDIQDVSTQKWQAGNYEQR
jgi:Tfp pilus assembly protein FimT